LCARARASGSPEPRRGRALGMAALGQGSGDGGYGLQRRSSEGSCRRTTKETRLLGLRYRWLNGGRSTPDQGKAGEARQRRSLVGLEVGVLGAAAIRCRERSRLCRAELQHRCRGTGRRRGGALVAAPSPSFFFSPPLFLPLTSSLLAAAAEGEFPWWLGFSGCGRGGFIGEALGFRGGPDAGEWP
jgi:hypothetical protein